MKQDNFDFNAKGLRSDLNTRIPALLTGVCDFAPAYFGLVMATGIISVASLLVGFPILGLALFWLNLAAYGVILSVNLARIVLFPRVVWRQLTDHVSGPGFFTSVAATAILGVQCVLIGQSVPAATVLWLVASALWLFLNYAIFSSFTVKESKPDLKTGINGAWLLAVVATQSIAVLSTLLAPHWHQPIRLMTNFMALSLWLWGGMLYIWMISLIFYRYSFFELAPDDLTPPYWINMGAMAISTLAGSLLVSNSADAPFIVSLLPFIKGFTVLYWATGTWWIPMLLILGVWRYGYSRYPLRYDPLYWGAVFPLGMYAVATWRMAKALDLGFLIGVSTVFFYVALGVWSLTLFGLIHSIFCGLIRQLRRSR